MFTIYHATTVRTTTSERLKARFSKHGRPSSTTSEVSKHIHAATPKHSIDLENTNVLAVEAKWFERGVKESIYIRAYTPTLNRDGGRYQLPPLWNSTIQRHVKRREKGNPKGGASACS